jgi:hypothetical protein
VVPLGNTTLVDADGVSPEGREWGLFLCNIKKVPEFGPNPEFCVINQDLLVQTIWGVPGIREASI